MKKQHASRQVQEEDEHDDHDSSLKIAEKTGHNHGSDY
jgi:hypothetical protein